MYFRPNAEAENAGARLRAAAQAAVAGRTAAQEPVPPRLPGDAQGGAGNQRLRLDAAQQLQVQVAPNHDRDQTETHQAEEAGETEHCCRQPDLQV